jgi:hypothetical protein
MRIFKWFKKQPDEPVLGVGAFVGEQISDLPDKAFDIMAREYVAGKINPYSAQRERTAALARCGRMNGRKK